MHAAAIACARRFSGHGGVSQDLSPVAQSKDGTGLCDGVRQGFGGGARFQHEPCLNIRYESIR